MMKKVFATALALALATGVTATAFAAEGSSTLTAVPGSQKIGVTGSYANDGNIPDVYSVDVEWGEMTFTYETTGDKTWDPATHTYNVDAADAWKAVGNEVKVTNHSNVPVNVAFSFAKDETSYKGEYTGSMSVASKELAAGVENKPTEADNVTSALTLSGTLNRVVDTATKLGDITVSLTAVTGD